MGESLNNNSILKIVFIILTYRNTDDILDLIDSIKEKLPSQCNYECVIVNSYYDEETKNKIEKIANDNSYVFINCENRGYSYGNQLGIKYAKDNIDYDFLVIANPDTVIKSFDAKVLSTCSNAIIAPSITNLRNRKQNPMLTRFSRTSYKLMYRGVKYGKSISFNIGRVINLFNRKFLLLLRQIVPHKKVKVFQPHGSFIIFSKEALNKLDHEPFDNNMFLFGEEGVLSFKAKEKQIPIYYEKGIKILHKEDGSMRFSQKSSINKFLIESNDYFYTHYFKK
jgi:GT2 family glycosyltransferase